ncbi:hypothetical protein CVIRNUC_006973 [Coccomyxa viridis]|uniref:Protein kinase domain-containing protein n=1 Tax=Coccomyxa viridis TaxID=1274662 RepID=A0AAV1I986_9CHLO|nr:hypothetical protein CVIRNUC_006973 [Coccomyxa viridis]
MSCFSCFSVGRRTGVGKTHGKDSLQDSNTSEKKAPAIRDGTDAAQVSSQPEVAHLESSLVGKPFPVDELGPCPPSNNGQRLETVKCVMEAEKNADPTLAPVLQLLCKILHVETACVTMIVEDGVLVKQGTGMLTQKKVYPQPGVCHWILVPDKPQTMIVEDMQQDARTSTTAVVAEAPHMRFYAAAPLIASNGHVLGTLCLWDTKPRAFDSNSAAILANFAELVVRELEMSAVMKLQLNMANMLKRAMDCYQQSYLFVDVSAPGWQILHVNQAFTKCTGLSRERATNALFWDLFSSSSCRIEEPWLEHQDMLTEKRPFQINSLRCTACCNDGESVYSALVRPATTDRVDADAMVIGIPAGSFSSDLTQKTGDYFFVVLRSPQEASRQQTSSPIKGLRMGPQLGIGTQGRVYRGTLDGQAVAVKIVDNVKTLRKIGAMPLEAALLRDLRHARIVNLLKSGFALGSTTAERQLWLVTELCDKGPLELAVDKGLFRTAPTPKAPPCLNTILQTALEIAEGLAFLHSCCVVHCDLSAGNVLLCSDSEQPHGFSAKISDFGMCRIKDMVAQESLQGTYSHMAPEVIEGQEFSEASDVYALGVLVWEMYNGQRAWSGLHFAQLSYAMFVEKRMLQFPEGTPEGLKSLASRCLARAPTDRPSSQELPALLKDLISDSQQWKHCNSL